MIPIFIISLKDSPRRGLIGPAMERLGIPFEFFDAVDGRRMSQAELAAAYEGSRPKFQHLSPGEIGCALSHMSIYRKMVADNIPAAIVLEDDAEVGPSLYDFIARIPDIPMYAGLISFFSTQGIVRRRPAYRFGAVGYHAASTMPWSTVGYFIRRSAAEVFVRRNPRISRTADWPIGFHLVRSFVVVPPIVRHEDHGSSTLSADRRRRLAKGMEAKKGKGHRHCLRERFMKKFRRMQRTWQPSGFINLDQLTASAAQAGPKVTPEC
jgi:glycosyl transferase family 25